MDAGWAMKKQLDVLVLAHLALEDRLAWNTDMGYARRHGNRST